MINLEIISQSSSETKKIGYLLSQSIFELKKSFYQKALILALVGDLGSGKTTFAQGFAKGLGIKEKILSPSFVILKRFPIRHVFFENFYHIDCYRLQKAQEVKFLNFSEIIKSPKNIILIEWAEKIEEKIPLTAFWLYFNYLSKDKRKLIICSYLSYESEKIDSYRR